MRLKSCTATIIQNSIRMSDTDQMKIQTNISADSEGRLREVLADGETVAGLFAAAVEREISRRERGGTVVVADRKPGRPRKLPE